MKEWKRLISSFAYAVEGIFHTFKHEKNMRIHGWMGLLITLLCWWVGLAWWKYLSILFAITWVWILELLNTAIENSLDIVTKEQHPLVKIAKDSAAGAVLLAAGFSVVLGVSLLLLPLAEKVGELHNTLYTLTPTIAQGILIGILMLALFVRLWHWHQRESRHFWIPFIIFFTSFLLFYFVNHAWIKVFLLFFPLVSVIFFRRGIAFFYGCLQVFLAGLSVWTILLLTRI